MEKTVSELKEIIKAKDKIIAEMTRDMYGTLRELETLRAKVNELERRA